jgi:hypothetical protein
MNSEQEKSPGGVGMALQTRPPGWSISQLSFGQNRFNQPSSFFSERSPPAVLRGNPPPRAEAGITGADNFHPDPVSAGCIDCFLLFFRQRRCLFSGQHTGIRKDSF